MSCYHPIYAVRIGTKENGKADLKMLGYTPDDRETMLNGITTSILVPLSFHCPVVSVSDAALTIQGNGQTVVCLNLSIMIPLGSVRSLTMMTMFLVPITLTLRPVKLFQL